jgi:hypothetical protein
MRLRPIDKQIYARRYRIVFAAIVAALIIISLSVSALLIRWFGSEQGSNFWLNLAGVGFAGLTVSWVIYRLRQHPWLDEVVYVWQLKQQLNRIYRKQRHIEPLVEQNDHQAIVIMNYMYQGSRQLFELDDNTITMEDLALKINALNSRIESLGLRVSSDDYSPQMLDRY